MLKLANQVIDVHDDIGHVGIHKLASVCPTINVMGDEDRSKLKDGDFALSIMTKRASKLNKFPIADHDSTWLSNQYFEMNYHKLPKTAAAVAAHFIKKACAKYKIKPEASVEKLAAAANTNVWVENESVKPAPVVQRISLEKFAEVEKIASNHTHAQYAFPTQKHIKVACDYFEKSASKMPLEIRHKYAAAIQRRAEELGMPAQGGLVSKYAGSSYSGMVGAHIRARASLLEAHPEKLAGLNKLAAARESMDPSTFALALHAFDKQAHLTQYYGAHLTNPYEATFTKHAGPAMVKVGKQSIPHDELKSLAIAKYAKIKEYFGGHFADEMKKDAVAIFESLPNTEKEVFVGIANGTL